MSAIAARGEEPLVQSAAEEGDGVGKGHSGEDEGDEGNGADEQNKASGMTDTLNSEGGDSKRTGTTSGREKTNTWHPTWSTWPCPAWTTAQSCS